MAVVDTGRLRTRQGALASTIGCALARMAERFRKRRSVAELSSVDPRILKDIGIDRSEINSIVYTDAKDRRRAPDTNSGQSSILRRP